MLTSISYMLISVASGPTHSCRDVSLKVHSVQKQQYEFTFMQYSPTYKVEMLSSKIYDMNTAARVK